MERTIRRGDIYYADLNPVIGSEQGGTRPVLIISNDIGNKYSPTVIIAAITSRVRTKAKLPTHTAIKDFEGLSKDSVILLEQIRTIDKKRLREHMIRQQQELVQEIRDAINEIVCGVEYDDEFYKHILDKMVVNDKDNIDVYLNLLPMKWSYTVAKASKKALAPERNISGASVPMSVSRPFNSA